MGLIEAKPEVLGTIYPYRKDVTFYVLQFCIQNFLSVQLLRRYEFYFSVGATHRKDVSKANFLSVQLLRRYEFLKK